MAFVNGLCEREGDKPCYPLEHLSLDCLESQGYWGDEEYEELFLAISDGLIGNLRRIEFWYRLNARPPKRCVKQVEEISELLSALATENGKNMCIEQQHAGAYICKG